MVDRKILEERGIFTDDMGELSDRMNELHSTVCLLVPRAHEGQDHDLAFALGGVARALVKLSHDFSEVEAVLEKSGAIVSAEEDMAKKQAAEAAPPAKVIAIVAGKTVRRSRKAVRR